MTKKERGKMSKAISVLNGARFEGAVTVTEAGLQGMITLRGDLSSKTLRAAVKSATGAEMPETRKITQGAKGKAAWMSTDELLLVVDYAEADAVTAQLTSDLSAEHHLAVNVSDARAMFRIEGAGAREVLAKGAPVDLSRQVFGVGDLRRSRVGQLAAAFWILQEDTFELVCFRSVGEFVFDWLSLAADKDSLPGYLA